MFSVFSLIGAALLLLGGIALTEAGFDKIHRFRQLERVPRIEAAAVLPGEVNLSGQAAVWRETLRSPDTHTRTLYYRYLVEREETDSDGDKRWTTVSDETRHVPFWLDDGSGRVLIRPEGAEVSLEADRVRHSGDYRYTEFRIDPGEAVFAFGMARETGAVYTVGFTEPGSYSPILSDQGEEAARGGMALASLLLALAGVGALGLAVMLFCFALRVHQTVLLLGGTALVLMGALGWLGVRTARLDVSDAAAREQRALSAASAVVDAAFTRAGLAWDGDWRSLAAEVPPQARLPNADRYRVDRIRLFLHRGAARAERLRAQWPERWFVRETAAPEIPLTADESLELKLMEARFTATRLGGGQALAMGIPGVLAALLLGWLGFRRVRLKRLIENLPTTRTGGVTYGLNEVSGRVVLPAETSALSGPLSGRACVSYDYKVEERRGSGKNRSWVTVEHREAAMPFELTDADGALRVEPKGAEIITRHRDQRRNGDRRYTETRLEPNDKLYALGYAAVSVGGDSLIMRREEGLPFLLSNYSEREVLLRKARAGFLLLVLGMIGGVAVGLASAGQAGAFGALPWLACAAIPLSYLLFILAVLMYNDLVFLRQRIRATWGNIEVSLRKRVDLVPNLERVVKAYMRHEPEVQRLVAELRRQADQTRFSRAEGAALMGTERRLMALIERYPALKAEEATGKLMDTLRRLENEIAFMREGHNNAVERYQTRRGQFPEVLIARTFGFRPQESFDSAPSS